MLSIIKHTHSIIHWYYAERLQLVHLQFYGINCKIISTPPYAVSYGWEKATPILTQYINWFGWDKAVSTFSLRFLFHYSDLHILSNCRPVWYRSQHTWICIRHTNPLVRGRGHMPTTHCLLPIADWCTAQLWLLPVLSLTLSSITHTENKQTHAKYKIYWQSHIYALLSMWHTAFCIKIWQYKLTKKENGQIECDTEECVAWI